MDTVRADHMSLYGYERNTTPNLNKLAQEATLYSQAIAPSDMTLPTHASIFTGLYAKKHGARLDPPAYGLGRPLADGFHTMAEILSEKGYSTMAVVANHAYVSKYFGLAQGFRYYDQRAPVPFLGKPHIYYLRRGIREIATRFASPPLFEMSYRPAEDITMEAFACLAKAKSDNRAFFLFLNYMDTHWPYIPPPPFDNLYPGKNSHFNTVQYTDLSEEVMRLDRKVTENEYRHMVSQYDGGITYIDHHIGELLKKLKEFGFYEHSLIIITSDHGETFGERNFVGHIVSVYQDQVHVPLIIKYPMTGNEIIIWETVSIIDIMPTILDVLRYSIPQNVDGTSLLRLDSRKHRTIMTESFPSGWLFKLHPRFKRIERAIFSGRLKFISSTNGKRELYDLSIDPNEKINLYKAGHEIVQELVTRLSQWLDEEPEVQSKSSSVEIDTGTLERLKSLGYAK
jgi:arylsulfatase A-like enzyme